MGPAGPCAPAGPAGPCGPVAPGAPAGPCGPSGPTAPAGPCGPAGPAAPAGPAGPATPCGPAGPTSPLEGPTQLPFPSMTSVPRTVTDVGWMSPVASFAASAYGTLVAACRGESSGSDPTVTPTYRVEPSHTDGGN